MVRPDRRRATRERFGNDIRPALTRTQQTAHVGRTEPQAQLLIRPVTQQKNAVLQLFLSYECVEFRAVNALADHVQTDLRQSLHKFCDGCDEQVMPFRFDQITDRNSDGVFFWKFQLLSR